MYLKLDGRGPRYTQLTRAMKAAMLSGRIGAGERLPAPRALAGELGAVAGAPAGPAAVCWADEQVERSWRVDCFWAECGT
jgi:hypothetical protein